MDSHPTVTSHGRAGHEPTSINRRLVLTILIWDAAKRSPSSSRCSP